MGLDEIDRSDVIHALTVQFPSWWDNIRNNEDWQRGAFYGLALCYTSLAVVALVQLIRIERRVPEYGWTTQKVFHLLNLLVCSLRAAVMTFRFQLQDLHQVAVSLLANDIPGLLFFTTYTLLVLFWAEIYHQAKSQSTARLRPTFLAANVAVYIVHVALLLLTAVPALSRAALATSAWFLVAVSLLAAAGFLMYGGRLFVMLRRFPIESRGRKKKLREVGAVTLVCTLCFSARALLIALGTVDARDFALDIARHPLLNLAYYASVEIVPSALVLYILRKLPPKRPPMMNPPMVSQPDVEAR